MASDSLDGLSLAGRVSKEANEETANFLADVCYSIEYADYPNLKVQTFMRLRQLAMSDEFEEVPDEARKQAMRTTMDLDELRAHPEYEAMRATLRKAFLEAAERQNAKAEDWLDKVAKPAARKAMARSLRSGISGENREAAKVAVEILERDMPKLSRNNQDVPLVMIPEEQVKLLARALAITEKRIEANAKAIPAEVIQREEEDAQALREDARSVPKGRDEREGREDEGREDRELPPEQGGETPDEGP